MKLFILSLLFLISFRSVACDSLIGKYVSCTENNYQIEVQKIRPGKFLVIFNEDGQVNKMNYDCIKDRLVYKKAIFANGFTSTLAKSPKGITSSVEFFGMVGEMIKDLGAVIPQESLCAY